MSTAAARGGTTHLPEGFDPLKEDEEDESPGHEQAQRQIPPDAAQFLNSGADVQDVVAATIREKKNIQKMINHAPLNGVGTATNTEESLLEIFISWQFRDTAAELSAVGKLSGIRQHLSAVAQRLRYATACFVFQTHTHTHTKKKERERKREKLVNIPINHLPNQKQ